MPAPTADDLVWHPFYAIVNTIPKVWPYRHLVLENFLHPALYRALTETDFGPALTRRHDPGKITQPAEGNRFVLRIDRQTDADSLPAPLGDLWRSLTATRLTDLLLQKFAEDIARRHGPARVPTTCGIEMIEDRTGYALLPHVDAHQKMVTVLIYLAEPGADETLGTTLYTPNNTKAFSATFSDTARLDRAHFGIAATAPYRPNTALIFAPGGNTFHGVEAVAPGTSRRLIQFQINRDTPA